MANLIDLIQADGGTFRKVAGTGGGEFAGACPFCGGNDRFRIWPETGRYWCRGCDAHGDAIQYLKEKRGLSFIEACDFLGRDPGQRKNAAHPAPAPWAPKDAKAPSILWQEKAKTFLDGAIACLWSKHGDEMRRWLRDQKGLSNETAKGACLGLNLTDSFEPRALWGLDPSLKDDGTEKKQWLPAGLVIANAVSDSVCRLRIRRDNPGDGAPYVVVSGSSMGPMILNPDRGAAVIVESELDALLLNKEAGDLVTCIAMGSAGTKPDTLSHDILTRAETVLISLDSDPAGAKASWDFWPAVYGGKVKRWPVVGGKDPSEARANGLDLRQWIVAGLFGSELRFERFCVQTVDGNMTDNEAMKAMAR